MPTISVSIPLKNKFTNRTDYNRVILGTELSAQDKADALRACSSASCFPDAGETLESAKAALVALADAMGFAPVEPTKGGKGFTCLATPRQKGAPLDDILAAARLARAAAQR